MKHGRIIHLVAGITCGAILLFGQGKAPAPKSQKEAEAINAMFTAQDPDSQIKAAEALLTKYADTDFKGLALYVEANAYQNKNDAEKAIIYAERMLEVDKASLQAAQGMVMIGKITALRTREFDLDKEEKLGKAEKMATASIDVFKVAPKSNPGIPDDQWEVAKKDGIASAHEVLALVASTRKKNDVALAEYKLALDSPTPDPSTMLRYASVLNTMQKWDEAIAMTDKILATPDLHPTIKDFATKEKDKATKAKASAK
ncbi:MAG: hypothetical protein ABI693_03915 [Bryobacteraceae bacterium]